VCIICTAFRSAGGESFNCAADYDDMAKKCDESLVQATAQLGTHGGELASGRSRSLLASFSSWKSKITQRSQIVEEQEALAPVEFDSHAHLSDNSILQ
jgi:hypothetical protein